MNTDTKNYMLYMCHALKRCTLNKGWDQKKKQFSSSTNGYNFVRLSWQV